MFAPRSHPALALLVVLVLGGCSPAIEPAPGPPAGWQDLPHCDGAPETPWRWIEGFPAAEIEAAGLEAECGDVWLENDGDHFLGVLDSTASEAQLEAFGAALEASGYELHVDDLDFAVREAGSARDYYTADLQAYVAIELYPVDGSDLWRAYIDFHSPKTRAIR